MTFRPASLRFFRSLRRNNAKPWFEAHRPEYEEHVRAPMRMLIEELDVRLARFAPEITGDPRRSMFRINRDIRFSTDKSPYKTHAACWLYHRDGDRKVGSEAESGGAGFYFHLAPNESFVGGGIWMPPRPVLNRLRDAIAENPVGFGRVAGSPAIKRRFGGLSQEEMLKRMPRGYADDHPAAKWLRYQSFTLGRRLTDEQVMSPRLGGVLERDFQGMLPLVRWLNAALGLRTSGPR